MESWALLSTESWHSLQCPVPQGGVRGRQDSVLNAQTPCSMPQGVSGDARTQCSMPRLRAQCPRGCQGTPGLSAHCPDYMLNALGRRQGMLGLNVLGHSIFLSVTAHSHPPWMVSDFQWGIFIWNYGRFWIFDKELQYHP